MEAKLLSVFGQGQPSGGGFYLQAGRHISRCTFQPTQGWEGFGAAKRLRTYPCGAIRVPFGEVEHMADSLDSAKAWLAEIVERSGRTLESANAGPFHADKPEGVLIVHGHPRLSAINLDSRLYVLREGDGFSCYGFDVLERKAAGLAECMLADSDGVEMATAGKGTPQAFDAWAELVAIAREQYERHGRRCEAELTPALKGLEGKRVEVERDGELSRFIVGRSTGWIPVHLEIKRRNSSGGEPVYWPEGARVVRVLENVR
jgi:hypothetical protein